MGKKAKKALLYKKEVDRTRKERVCRDVAFYCVTILAAFMGFLLVDANIDLANAELDLASNVVIAHAS